MKWCAFLMEHDDDARKTLMQENVSREGCVVVGDFIIGFAEFSGEKQPSDMTNPLNIEHQKNIEECLERVSGKVLYDISTVPFLS